MRKYLLFLFLSANLYGFAQDIKFKIEHEGVVLSDGAKITISTAQTVGSELRMKFKVNVTNISSSKITMFMKGDPGSVMNNTKSTLCWLDCKEGPGITVESPEFNSGQTESPYAELILNASGEALDGTSTVVYTFGTNSKGDTPLSVTVDYVYTKPVVPPTPEEPETPPTPPTEPETPPTPEEPETPPTPPAEPEDPTNIEQTPDSDMLTVYSVNGSLIINSPKPQTIYIYEMNGKLVRTLKHLGESSIITDLQKDVYIVNGHKVIIK